MTAPCTKFPIEGIIWYQGESDSGRAMQYTALLEAMIRDWRRGFESPTLPFIAAQLPIYGADPHNEDWAGIREAQQKVCASDPNCRAVCLLDCGEKDNYGDIEESSLSVNGLFIALFESENEWSLYINGDDTHIRLETDMEEKYLASVYISGEPNTWFA